MRMYLYLYSYCVCGYYTRAGIRVFMYACVSAGVGPYVVVCVRELCMRACVYSYALRISSYNVNIRTCHCTTYSVHVQCTCSPDICEVKKLL